MGISNMTGAPGSRCESRLLAEAGRPVPAIDSLPAATALAHGLRLVTRNVAAFVFPGFHVLTRCGFRPDGGVWVFDYPL